MIKTQPGSGKTPTPRQPSVDDQPETVTDGEAARMSLWDHLG